MALMQDGDFNKDSDIDIMILTDFSDEEIIEYRDKISDIAFDIEFDNEFNVILSPLIKNIDKCSRGRSCIKWRIKYLKN